MSKLTEWWADNRPVMLTAGTRDKITAQAAGYESAYKQAPWWFTQQHYLSEMDSQYIDLLMRWNQGTMVVSPFGNNELEPQENDRLAVVKWSRWWSLYDPLISGAVQLWTDYGFGHEVTVNAVDQERIQPIWEEFWNAPRNRKVFGQRNLHKMSNTLLTDGEVFMVLWIVAGQATARMIPTDEITRIITLPEDQDQVLFYQREYFDADGTKHVKLYPDWLASEADLDKVKMPDGATRADTENPARSCKVISYLLNPRNNRGWPLCVASQPWAKAYKQIVTDQAAVHAARASTVEEWEVEGGSRIVASLQQQLQSGLAQGGAGYENNPPAGAGSTRVQNKAIKTKRLGLETGASDAAQDSMLLLGQVAVGMRVTTAMLGRTDSMQNKAIAEVAMRPTLRAWTRYQQGWQSFIEDIFNLVLDAAGVAPTADRSVVISLSSAMETDFQVMVNAIDSFWTSGAIDKEVLTTIALHMPEFALPDDLIDATMQKMYPKEEESPAEVLDAPTAAGLQEQVRELRVLLQLAEDRAAIEQIAVQRGLIEGTP